MAESNPTVALLPDHDSLARDPKSIEDYSKEVDALLESISQSEKDAFWNSEISVGAVFELEKKARQACDAISVSRLACKLLEFCKNDKDWEKLGQTVVLLCKKRGQLKRVITDMIALCMSWLDETPSREEKLKLIRTLSAIAEGKIFIEVERARLIRIEAAMIEEDGDIEKAALLLQEVQVETFGAMDRREKSLYILDQMRLVLARNDYVRCQIVSKKMNPKFLDVEGFEDIKLRYYKHMVQYFLHEKDFLNTAKSFWSLYNTKQPEPSEDWKEFLSKYVFFLIIAPHTEEALKLLKELAEIKQLKELPHINNLVSDFLSTELADWPLSYEAQIKSDSAFEDEARWEMFRSRFMQHNVIILSTYYSRINISKAASLLNISTDEVELFVSSLVNERIVYARIDRPAGVVSFEKPATAATRLDSWAADISSLLDLLQETSHLIGNERMVHAALEKRKQLLEKPKA